MTSTFEAKLHNAVPSASIYSRRDIEIIIFYFLYFINIKLQPYLH